MWLLVLFLIVFVVVSFIAVFRMRQIRDKLEESNSIRHDLISRYEPLMVNDSLRKPGTPGVTIEDKATPVITHDDFVKLIDILKGAGYGIAFTHEPGELSQSTPSVPGQTPDGQKPETGTTENPSPTPGEQAAPDGSQTKKPATKNHKRGTGKK